MLWSWWEDKGKVAVFQRQLQSICYIRFKHLGFQLFIELMCKTYLGILQTVIEQGHVNCFVKYTQDWTRAKILNNMSENCDEIYILYWTCGNHEEVSMLRVNMLINVTDNILPGTCVFHIFEDLVYFLYDFFLFVFFSPFVVSACLLETKWS